MSPARTPERQDATLQAKLDALAEATELGRDRVPETALAAAREVLDHAGRRRRLSAEHTVVGFFGATGSGKSSLFNAVTGHPLARTAATRPTTSEPLAAVWGAEGAGPLLDWLEVGRRHVLDGPAAGAEVSTRWGGRRRPGGLILLDLPDFDSIAVDHRTVVQRLAGQVDVLVWVVDPQKYADAALHRQFLEPLAAHRAVTLVVLNQVDRLAGPDVGRVVASLQDLLTRDGLVRVPVHSASAVTGEGIDGLRRAIAEVAAERSAATERLLSDVRTAARALGAGDAEGVPAGVVKGSESRLVEALDHAAGAPTVVRAVDRSYRLEAGRRTGWPLLRWAGRIRQDPLRRLGLRRDGTSGAGRDGAGGDDPRVHRTSLPDRSPAQRAQADGAIRAFADAASEGAPDSWRTAVRRAARGDAGQLSDDLDQAISSTDLRAGRGAWWWHLVNVLHWLALLVAVAGLAWLGGLAVAGYLQFRVPPAPDVEGFPVPTLMAAGGLAFGLLLALLTAPLVGLGARARAGRARRRLRARIAQVATQRVVDPVRAEIDRYGRFREALAAASGRH